VDTAVLGGVAASFIGGRVNLVSYSARRCQAGVGLRRLMAADTVRSAVQLGRRAGVSQPHLSRFLRGQRTPTLPAAAKVCEVLKLRLIGPDDGGTPSQGGTTRHDQSGSGKPAR